MLDLTNVNAYDYDLPAHLIAQSPLNDRSSSKLLVLDRQNDVVTHMRFSDILSQFNEGDCLVLNQTKVLPARLFGYKETGAKIEVMLTKEISDKTWMALTRPGRKVNVGTKLTFSEKLQATCVEVCDDGQRVYQFTTDLDFYEAINQVGVMPLPPYIHDRLDDNDRYQTVFSDDQHIGSVAAPTAGLHFDEQLLAQLQAKGVKIAYVTLHVGLGTFLPMSTDSVYEHKMHSESYVVDQENADIINETKKHGKRVIPVGTTSLRTIETIASQNEGKMIATSGDTNIFIYPSYEFKITDALITNFHLPKSTLIMLVCALASHDQIMNAYAQAIANEYRFFSFGDAMLIK